MYPHTFTVNQSSVPAALTIARANPLNPQPRIRRLDSFELSAEAGDWVQVESTVKARAGQAAVLTPAFVAEKEFTSKHMVVKVADSEASLSGATALKVSSVKLNISRDSEPFNPLGTDDQPEFDRGAFEASGEFVLRYTDTQYEEDYLSNAIKAMSFTMTNDTTSLAFTAPKVRFREFERSIDKDGVVTQTSASTVSSTRQVVAR